VPLHRGDRDRGLTHEFKTLEFRKLREKEPKLLHFKITTLDDGKSIQSYDDKNVVHMDLQFTNE
jgi:hypothetical protein